MSIEAILIQIQWYLAWLFAEIIEFLSDIGLS